MALTYGNRAQLKQADRWANLNADGIQPARYKAPVADTASKGSPRRPLPHADSYGTGGASAMPAPSASSSSAMPSARTSGRPPLEKLLGLKSNSTFVTATQSMGLGDLPSEPPEWSQEMPAPISIPKNKPCSRADAAVLNRWITSLLDRYAEKMAAGEAQQLNLTQMVDELVPLLSLGLHELVRQVKQSCNERGVVLEKIWRSYVELFDRALAETRALLRFHQARTNRVKDKLQSTSSELLNLKQRHPEQIQKLSKTLASKFVQRQEELERLLKNVRNENAIFKNLIHEHMDSTKSWFPLLHRYKDSQYKAILQNTGAELPSATTPESRIAADFKRILMALNPEARRRVGFFVSSLLGLRGTELVENPETIDSLTEWRDHNTWKISNLENRVKELRELRGVSKESSLSRGESKEKPLSRGSDRGMSKEEPLPEGSDRDMSKEKPLSRGSDRGMSKEKPPS